MESDTAVEVKENECLEPTEVFFNDEAVQANFPNPDLPYHRHCNRGDLT